MPHNYFASFDELQDDVGKRPHSNWPSSRGTRHISCLKFNPFIGNLFLVGQSDSQCRLHQVHRPTPVLSWSLSRETCNSHDPWAITEIEWSPQRAGVFFVLHSNGTLHTFDLCRDDIAPVFTLLLPDDLNKPISTLPLRLSVVQGGGPDNQCLALTLGGAVFIRRLSAYLSRQHEDEVKTLHARIERHRATTSTPTNSPSL